MFKCVESLPDNDLIAALSAVGAVTDRDLEASARIPRSAGARALALPNPFSGTNEEIALLAIGFAWGEPGSLVVPYSLRGDG